MVCSGDRGDRDHCEARRYFFYVRIFIFIFLLLLLSDQRRKRSLQPERKYDVEMQDQLGAHPSWDEHVHILAVIRQRVRRCRRLLRLDAYFFFFFFSDVERRGSMIHLSRQRHGFFWRGAASSAAEGEGHGPLCSFCTVHPARHLPGNILDRSEKVRVRLRDRTLTCEGCAARVT